MIKGCSRRMIILKDTGSDFFEEAYFVLKSGSPFCALRSEKDFVAEANRIVAESRSGSGFPPLPHPQKNSKKRLFFGGMLTGISLCGFVAALWQLIH